MNKAKVESALVISVLSIMMVHMSNCPANKIIWSVSAVCWLILVVCRAIKEVKGEIHK